MKKLIFLFLILVIGCTSTSSEESTTRPEEWYGAWSANWKTPPENYPEIEGMQFTMDGEFLFTKDSLTVTANGYPGCIFNIDTLAHTQTWYISNDSLFLINQPGAIGMTYKVLSKNSERISLQLMNDIFITLQR